MLISPTGTGYVNYCADAAAQYLTLGDIAIVTLQYSKRSSPRSLVRIVRPGNKTGCCGGTYCDGCGAAGGRPRVVLFGESLGAHTSQDVLLHWGTLGPQALGIDRRCGSARPTAAGGCRRSRGPPRPMSTRTWWPWSTTSGSSQAMTPERRNRLRYVLVSHDNDGVTKLGADLSLPSPWLAPRAARSPRTFPGPARGVSRRHAVAADHHLPADPDRHEKCASSQGYRAFAHDYRPDLAPFISAVYDLPATNEQMTRVPAWHLEERETARLLLFAPPEPG